MQINWRRSGGRDLHAEFKCTCPSKLFKDSPIADIMKTTVQLSGYDDQNYWDNVNKEPREFQCECGKKYTQQWYQNGTVEVIEIINQ